MILTLITQKRKGRGREGKGEVRRATAMQKKTHQLASRMRLGKVEDRQVMCASFLVTYILHILTMAYKV